MMSRVFLSTAPRRLPCFRIWTRTLATSLWCAFTWTSFQVLGVLQCIIRRHQQVMNHPPPDRLERLDREVQTGLFMSTAVPSSCLPTALLSACAAPQRPPSGVRVTLIEDDTALVSWREPAEPNVVVTRYNILYASQTAWLAGRWQIMQREGEWLTAPTSNRGSSCCPPGCCHNRVLTLLPPTGSHTMALLEKLEPGSVYVVKISAANQVGDGPFSQMVELAPKRGSGHRSKNPRHSSPDTAGTSGAEVAAGGASHPASLTRCSLSASLL